MGVPVAIEVTNPVILSTVANDVLLLYHLPPVVASVSDVVLPAHTEVVPVMATGVTFTVVTNVL